MLAAHRIPSWFRYDSVMQLLRLLAITFSMTVLLSAQGPPPKFAATSSAMSLTISGFPDGGQIPVKFSQAAPGVAAGEGTSPGDELGQRPRWHTKFFPSHARLGPRSLQDH